MQQSLIALSLGLSANAAQVGFFGYGGGTCVDLSTAALRTAAQGLYFEQTGTPFVTDTCMDLTAGASGSVFSVSSFVLTSANANAQATLNKVYGKLTCGASPDTTVSDLKLYSDAACSNTTLGLTAANSNATTGYTSTNAHSCAAGSFGSRATPLPFVASSYMKAACLDTARSVVVQSTYTDAACTTLQAAGEPYGSSQKATLPMAVGGCIYNDPTTTTFSATGAFRRPTITSGGVVFEKFNANTAATTVTIGGVTQRNSYRIHKMTAAQCGTAAAGVVTAVAAAHNATTSVCSCSQDTEAGFADDEACQIIGATCIDPSTGAAAVSSANGVCGVLARKVDTTGQADGTAVGQCGNIANARAASPTMAPVAAVTTAGVFTASGTKCKCYSSSQCKSDSWCLTVDGQQASASNPGLCGTFDATLVASDGQCHPMYKVDSATAVPIGVCQADKSIMTISGSNMALVSGVSAIVAISALFA